MADFLMEDNIFSRIESNYNEAIDLCKKNNYLGNCTSTNEFCCVFKKILGYNTSKPLAKRPLAKRRRVGPAAARVAAPADSHDEASTDSDDDPPDPLHKNMCSCRLSAMIMFTMLKLNQDTPTGDIFFKEYYKIRDTHLINNLMYPKNLRGHNVSLGEGNAYYKNKTFESTIPTILPKHPDLYIVQILQVNVTDGAIGPVHSFIVKVDVSTNVDVSPVCHVLSAWNDDEKAIPPTYKIFDFNTLQKMLESYRFHGEKKEGEQIEWLEIKKERCEELFGTGTSLGENLIVLFLNESLILNKGLSSSPSYRGGKKKLKTKYKNKKSKRKKKRKTKKKRKINI